MSTAIQPIELTKRQREVYDVVREFLAFAGYPPTFRELAKLLGVRSTNSIMGHLRKLAAKGWIELLPNSPRAIRLLREPAPVVYVIERWRRNDEDSLGWEFCGVCDSLASANAAMGEREDLRVRAVTVNEVMT